MNGTAIAMSLVLILAGVTAVPLSGVAQPGIAIDPAEGALQTTDDATNETANETATNETAPGARLAGVVGAQEAEVRGEVDSRAFDVALERADSEEARARVVAERFDDLEERLAELEERKRELQRAHRNGNITTATYRAEVTELSARTESARGIANKTGAAARGLPPDVAERQGINVTAIETLERRAANLTGPEVARIARSIAGPDVGKPVSAGPPDHAKAARNGSAGPPDDRGDSNASNRSVRDATGTDGSVAGENASDRVDNASDAAGDASDGADDSTGAAGDGAENASEDATAAIDRAEARIDDAAARIDDADLAENATALADAEAALADARDDLEAARAALDDGNPERARRLAERATERAERAEALVEDAADSP